MRQVRKVRMLACIPALCFGAAFLPVALLPLVQRLPGTSRKLVTLLVGLAFWGFLIAGIAATGRVRQKLYPIRTRLKREGRLPERQRAGLLCFSREKSHLAVYGLFALCLILLLLDAGLHFLPEAAALPVIALSMFLIALHGVIDGENYKTAKALKERLEDGRNDRNQ